MTIKKLFFMSILAGCSALEPSSENIRDNNKSLSSNVENDSESLKQKSESLNTENGAESTPDESKQTIDIASQKAVDKGSVLYEKNCATCHNPLHSSTKKGSSFSKIKEALKVIPSMQVLSLKDQEIRHIEAALAAKSVCRPEHDPGNVFLRRLSNKELNNSIADLLNLPRENNAIFFEPLGSFSNIGSRQSLEVTHFDRLRTLAFDAASKFTKKLYSSGVSSYSKTEEAESLSGTTGQPEGSYYNIWSEGSISANFVIPTSGDYKLSVIAHASKAGDNLAKMQVKINDVPVFLTEVSSDNFAERQTFFVDQKLNVSTTKISVEFLNDFNENGADRNLYVDKLKLELVAADTKPSSILQACKNKLELEENCLDQFLKTIVEKAFRRPIDNAEKEEFRLRFKNLIDAEESMENAMAVVVAGIIMSADFLYKVESDSQSPEFNIKKLNQFELAARLSFFIWSSLPDTRLLDLAQKGELEKNLNQEVKRMLSDSKAEALADVFAREWLELGRLEAKGEEASDISEKKLLSDVQKETREFLLHIFSKNLNIETLLTSNFTFGNKTVASLYGLEGSPYDENNFKLISSLPDERTGILTQPSVLKLTSHGNATSPVGRGLFVLKNFLCKEPATPVGIDTSLPETSSDEVLTIKDLYKRHRNDPTCSSCHQSIDPVGFAFEGFDENGKVRTRYKNGALVDSTGVLPNGHSVQDAKSITNYLLQAQQFQTCFSEKLLTFARGALLTPLDSCRVEAVKSRAIENGGSISDYIQAIIQDPGFTSRRPASSGD